MSRVIGVLLILVLVGVLLWFLLKKKKQKTDCEKVASGAAAVYEAVEGDKIASTQSQQDSIVSTACAVLGEVAKVGVAVAGATAGNASSIVSKGVSVVTGGGCEGCPPVTSAVKILGMKCADLRKYCTAAPKGGLPAAAFCKAANDRKCP